MEQDIMKCIYCNAKSELTSSDIITYAITGAKLTKSFVCHTHNAYTNDKYEKAFIAELDFFRNHLGLTTRDGKPIQYIADITVDGTEMHGVKISNRESLYSPKGVVAGVDDKGKKVLMAPMGKLEKISNGKVTAIDTNEVTLHKTISSDAFLGSCALHSIAKMAYECYCYINNIEGFEDEHAEIVNYILDKNNDSLVDIIADGNYFYPIDQLSEIGTNAFFQYDDIDGYRYIVFDLWNTIPYRVRIRKSPEATASDKNPFVYEIFLFHIDGRKSNTAYGTYPLDGSVKPSFKTVQPQAMTAEIWQVFINRIERIMKTMVMTIYALKREADLLSSKLKKYNAGKIDVAHLLGFEENNIATVIELLHLLHTEKERYDVEKSFNENLAMILNPHNGIVTKTPEDKIAFITQLVEMDKQKTLSRYIKEGIDTFNEIYEREENSTDN